MTVSDFGGAVIPSQLVLGSPALRIWSCCCAAADCEDDLLDLLALLALAVLNGLHSIRVKSGCRFRAPRSFRSRYFLPAPIVAVCEITLEILVFTLCTPVSVAPRGYKVEKTALTMSKRRGGRRNLLKWEIGGTHPCFVSPALLARHF